MKRHAAEVSYDPEANMAYVRVTEISAGEAVAQVFVHDEQLPSEIVIDLDRDGRILGFELFDASESLPEKLLNEFR